jgi:hypothetical protein
MSEGLDFSGPDRVDDAVFNNILWQMLKAPASFPVAPAKAPLHLLQAGRGAGL